MFVLNLKLDAKKVFTFCIALAVICVIALEIFGKDNPNIETNNSITYDYMLTDDNFTSILKEVHENIDTNVGKTVSLTGFVFRMPDFGEDVFVCGRNIIINDENNVAGFMCRCANAKDYLDNEWVTITGKLSVATYNTSMPIIEVSTIEKITAPANTYVENVESTSADEGTTSAK